MVTIMRTHFVLISLHYIPSYKKKDSITLFTNNVYKGHTIITFA